MLDFNMYDFMKYSCSTKKCVIIFFKIKLRYIDDVYRYFFLFFIYLLILLIFCILI